MKENGKKLSASGLAMVLTLGGLTLVAQGCSKRNRSSSADTSHAVQHKCGGGSCGAGSCGSGSCGEGSCGSGSCGTGSCGENSCG